MSWDVFRHGNAPDRAPRHGWVAPAPDPDTFGGTVALSARGGEWEETPTDESPLRRSSTGPSTPRPSPTTGCWAWRTWPARSPAGRPAARLWRAGAARAGGARGRADLGRDRPAGDAARASGRGPPGTAARGGSGEPSRVIAKDERRLRVGVLGCGPIAQFAHLEACAKARNADLYAICDVRRRPAASAWPATHAPQKTFADYDAMLADPGPRGGHRRHLRRLPRAGRDRGRCGPASTCCARSRSASRSRRSRRCRRRSRAPGKVLQVGHMKRFDAGLQAAKRLRRRRDGRAAGAQGLVLRQHPSLRR